MYTTLGQGQVMTLTFNTHIPSYIRLDVCSYQLSGHWLQYFLEIIISSDFHFLVPESLHTKYGSDKHRSLRKSGLNFCMRMTFGQGQVMALTFNTHIPSYIQLDVCSYQLSGHWLQYFLKNPLFSLFPIEKPMLPNLTLP